MCIYHFQNNHSADPEIKRSFDQTLTVSRFFKSADQKLLEQKHIHCFALISDSKCIGYLILSLVLDEAEIIHVFVLPEQRRKSYGKEILSHSIAYCLSNSVKKIFLELRVSNRAAYQLYKKQGFTDINIRKSYYSDGENACVMQKLL